MRTTVDLDADFLQKLRREAERTRVPFKQLLNATLRAGLAKPSARQPGAYVLPTFAMGSPRFDLDKAMVLVARFESDEVVNELERCR